MGHQLTMSSSPRLYGGDTTSRIMRRVIMALLPACGVSIIIWGCQRCWF